MKIKHLKNHNLKKQIKINFKHKKLNYKKWFVRLVVYFWSYTSKIKCERINKYFYRDHKKSNYDFLASLVNQIRFFKFKLNSNTDERYLFYTLHSDE